jgi:hypothetical protein
MSLLDRNSIVRPTFKSENGTHFTIDKIVEANKLSVISKEGKIIIFSSAPNEYSSSPIKGIYWPLKSIYINQIDF